MTAVLSSRLRRLHRASAMVVGAYALLHIANHIVGLAGIAWHLRFMHAARLMYRVPLIEVVLLACVAVQIATGLWLAASRISVRSGGVRARLQAASGALLSAFLAVHVAAVLTGRVALGLDTNFYFAAAGLHVAPWGYFFAPYYFVGVAALFGHIACASAPTSHTLPDGARTATPIAVFAIGCALASLFVMSLGGCLYPVDIPAEFKTIYLSNSR